MSGSDFGWVGIVQENGGAADFDYVRYRHDAAAEAIGPSTRPPRSLAQGTRLEADGSREPADWP